jgi:hypothetical protein
MGRVFSFACDIIIYMAQYKVPQDVEADDKLLGPFTFRQFVYLLIVAGFVALAWALFQVFPLLVIIPIPVILFFGALALPLKKDQPMETYLSAIVSYYLKPRKRFWEPGQAESTIVITAPKKVERARTKALSEDEATHRLSFLAEIVDSEGYAIKGASVSPMREEMYAEATSIPDMFEGRGDDRIGKVLRTEDVERHTELVSQMRAAIEKAENANLGGDGTVIQKFSEEEPPKLAPVLTGEDSAAVVQPTAPEPQPATKPEPQPVARQTQPAMPVAQSTSEATPSADIINLANNKDFSVETIAKQAQRLGKKHDGEVYVSLH